MIRFALALACCLGLAGCSTAPALFGESGGTPARITPASNDGFPTAPRSSLGMAAAQPAQTAMAEHPVSAKSSTKAPKGALADRDYSATSLDPVHALELINTYRASQGLPALKLDARLTVAAKVQARDLAKSDRISHYGSDGSSPWDRVKRSGYDAKLAAENVGTGQASLDEVFKGWTQSPGHNRNLLLPGARDMGIALVEDPKTEFKTFWTLVVASSK